MCTKFRAIVGGYSTYGMPVGEKQPDNYFCQWYGVFSLRELGHEYYIRASFSKGYDSALAIFADNGIHFPIAKTRSVSFGGTLMDANPVGDVPNFGCAVGSPMPVVLHLMSAMSGKPTGSIGTDITVD